jgi:hypothetical protein
MISEKTIAVCVGAVVFCSLGFGAPLGRHDLARYLMIDPPLRSSLQILEDRLEDWRSDGGLGRPLVEREAIAEAGHELEAARRLDERYHSLDRDDIAGQNTTGQERNAHRIRAAEILNAWHR